MNMNSRIIAINKIIILYRTRIEFLRWYAKFFLKNRK